MSRPRAATWREGGNSEEDAQSAADPNHRSAPQAGGGAYRCSHQDGAASGAELMQSFFSVPLGAVSMDTGAGVALPVQEVLQGVGSFLGLHKHQSQRVFACGVRGERKRPQIKKQQKDSAIRPQPLIG